ncbi:carbohydrate kinase [Sediminibacterium sp.]|uniref:carbohydrate kinase family protein n=1 Tax=Sediminibacterium sp. TaxID=1917865 RepID=UPI00273559D6|nr:carbohydrate kinase [Sediminibacterium sp.]MDP3392220.1 carbohydrate kinase [Sediminibacterium sp.]MDP3566978.1 carbohydrate kinase [Sediminibacterium sp.]
MKILCIGEALIDMICTNKGMSLSEGSDFLKKTGGAPTNVAAAIAALGGEVELAAKVGKDPFGKQLIQTMESFGVGTHAMLEDPNHFTTFAFVSLMHDGERDFVFNRGADGQLSIDDVDAINLNNVGIIHFGSATGFLPGPLQAAYLHLLQKALHHKIYISFDPNYRHLLFPNNIDSFISQSWHFLRNCNFFKVSDEEAMLLTHTSTLADATTVLLKETSGVFTITLGKDGTLLGLNGQQYIIESIPVKPVDTTGAGDAFVGAVLYQLSHLDQTAIQSLSLNEWNKIILNANKAGARTCEYMGAMEAFKYLNNQIFQ